MPKRVFLDTSVVNFILDFGENIHDAVQPSKSLSEYQTKDINALYNLFLIGARASWQLAISPHTYHEVIQTKNPTRHYWLEKWFFEIWEYWKAIIADSNNLPTL